MNRTSKLIMAGLVVVSLLASCKKEDNTNGKVVFRASMEQNDMGGSKTTLNPSTGVVSWTQGDMIKVYNGSGTADFTLVGDGGSSTGDFSGDIDESGEYTVGYPTSITTISSQKAVTFALPNTQELGEMANSFAVGANPMVAYATGLNLAFKNPCGLLGFALKGDGTHVGKIVLTSNNTNDILWGEMAVTLGNDGNITGITTTNTSSDKHILTMTSDVTLNVEEATCFFFVVPPITISNGFTVKIYDEEDATTALYEKNVDTEIALTSNSAAFNAPENAPVLPASESVVPVGAIKGKFSVNATRQVYFSKGNLQFYRRISYLVNGQPYWRFASEQYEIFGVSGHNQGFRDEFLAANYPSIGAANRDVFGWATSGWHDPSDDGNTNYEPWSIEFFSNGYTVANNTVGYGPSDGTKDITGEYANYDWGVYNSQEGRHIYVDAGITEASGSWRTLSLAEWNWVIGPDGTPGVNCRTASTVNGVGNARFAKAYLNVTISANASNANDASRRIHGLILFPDTYVHPSDVALPTGINDKTNTSWNANEYTAEEWAKMENAGAVFLPAAGQRNGFTTLPDSSGPAQVAHVNENGFYWSTTHDPYDLNQGGTIYPPCLAYSMQISSGSINTTNSAFSRNTGNAVRLVQDVE